MSKMMRALNKAAQNRLASSEDITTLKHIDMLKDKLKNEISSNQDLVKKLNTVSAQYHAVLSNVSNEIEQAKVPLKAEVMHLRKEISSMETNATLKNIIIEELKLIQSQLNHDLSSTDEKLKVLNKKLDGTENKWSETKDWMAEKIAGSQQPILAEIRKLKDDITAKTENYNSKNVENNFQLKKVDQRPVPTPQERHAPKGPYVKRKKYFKINKYQKDIMALNIFIALSFCVFITLCILFFNRDLVNMTLYNLKTPSVRLINNLHVYLIIGLWTFFAFLFIWTYNLSSRWMGAIERIFNELDDMIHKDRLKFITTRSNDGLARELAKRINGVISSFLRQNNSRNIIRQLK